MRIAFILNQRQTTTISSQIELLLDVTVVCYANQEVSLHIYIDINFCIVFQTDFTTDYNSFFSVWAFPLSATSSFSSCCVPIFNLCFSLFINKFLLLFRLAQKSDRHTWVMILCYFWSSCGFFQLYFSGEEMFAKSPFWLSIDKSRLCEMVQFSAEDHLPLRRGWREVWR